MPAYNAAETLEKTYREIPFNIVDDVILVDDFSRDDTVGIAEKIGIRHIIRHTSNQGYGGNQKSCYEQALLLNADIVVMLHPDYQYTPSLIEPMCSLIARDLYQVVIASRILGKGAMKGGMPWYKYLVNRLLTLFQNLMMKQKLSEYHTGYRAFSAEVLKNIPWKRNSDDYVFDNQMLAQILFRGYSVGEVSCPTRYADDASSITFARSIVYAAGVIKTTLMYFLQKNKLKRYAIFE